MGKIFQIEALRDLIADSERIVLVGHVNPDGDSIGSLIGMTEYLLQQGKEVMPVVPNNYPYYLRFLDPHERLVIYNQSQKGVTHFMAGATLVICMDFNSLHRIDELGERIAASDAVKVLIDHHPQPEDIFDVMYSDTDSSSTCELVYWILRGLNPGGRLPAVSATALYTGLMTDTNNFANSVRARTFRMAGELLEEGVDKEYIQRNVFGGFNESRMRLMGYMLYEKMQLNADYHTGMMVITELDKLRFGFEEGDSEGFVNLPLSIKGVQVSALFTQEKDCVKVSLRSKPPFSVNRFARDYFNGGGHEQAAGGKICIPVERLEEYFLKSMADFVERGK